MSTINAATGPLRLLAGAAASATSSSVLSAASGSSGLYETVGVDAGDGASAPRTSTPSSSGCSRVC